MRIALLGQAAFGADVLKGLLEHGHEVPGVFCLPDQGARPDPLKEAAQAAGAPVFQPAHLRDPEAYEAMVSLKADLGVLAFVTDIIPLRVFTPRSWAPSNITPLSCPAIGAPAPSIGR